MDNDVRMPFKIKRMIAIMNNRFWTLMYRMRPDEGARQLGELGDRRAVEPLVMVLKRKPLDVWNAELRLAAIEALGKLRDVRAVEPLLAILSQHSGLSEHDNEKERMHAARALVSIHDQAVDSILTLLRGNYDLRCLEPAAFVLREIADRRSIPVLTAVLKKNCSVYRGSSWNIAVADALAKISGGDLPRDVRLMVEQITKDKAEQTKLMAEQRRIKMRNIFTRVHVYSQRAFSDAEVMSIVKKLCPQALTSFPQPKITYSCLSAWPESVPSYLVGRFYKAGFTDSDFQADKVRFEEGTAWGSEICVVSISHPKGKDISL